MRLPKSLQHLVDGLKGGSGPRSLLSRLTIVGEKPDRVPIVVWQSRENGSSVYRETLATISALREDASGERILMLSWGSLASDSSSENADLGGHTDVIEYDLLLPIELLSGTLQSISPRPLTTGISGVPCDGCGTPFKRQDSYRTSVMPGPPGQSAGGLMRLLCLRCAEQSRTFMG